MLAVLGFDKKDLKRIPTELRFRVYSATPFQEASCVLICAPDLKRLEWYFLKRASRPFIFVYLPKGCDDFFTREANFIDGIIKEGEWNLLEAVLNIKNNSGAFATISLINAERECDSDESFCAKRVLKDFSEEEALEMAGSGNDYRIVRVFS